MSNSHRYAVFGNPIKHSKSPLIHRLFAAQCDQDLQYRAVRVAEGDFARAAAAFFDEGGAGLNVTVPFKHDAFEFAHQLSDRARRAGAVNTLIREVDGKIVGDNTDGVGIMRDITANLDWEVAGRSVLVLGAGGAVHGVIEPLVNARPASLAVINRTAQKAEKIAERFGEMLGFEIEGGGVEKLADRSFDIIINATSAGLSGEQPDLPDSLLNERTCCYDMIYGAEPTPFMRWAAGHAAWAVADGLGMLVEQAAESFYLWRGVRPDTDAVIRELRSVIQKG